MKLGDYLLERIAEEVKAAQDLADAGPWRPHRNETDLDWEVRCEAWGHMVTTGYVGNSDSRPLAEHIARWDPARVLADCEARRQIVELHRREWNGKCASCAHEGEDYGPEDELLTTCDSEPYPCPTLRALALPYALQWRKEQQA